MIGEQGAAFQAGYVVGSLVGVGLAAAATVKCVQVLRRPTTCKPGLVALALVCLSWLVCGLVGAASALLELPPPVLALVGGTFAAPFLLGTMVAAIVALATYDRRRHTQGRAQAVWAMVLAGLLGVVLGVVTAAGVDSGLVRPSAPLALEKPELNFGLTIAPPWVSMRGDAMNEDACLSLRRSNPRVNCIVIAEIVGDTRTQEGLVETSMANLASSAEVLERHDERVALHGSTFDRITTRVRMYDKGTRVAFDHWLLAQHGFAWQVVFFGEDSDRSEITAEAGRLMDTFRILEPERDALGQGSLVDVTRPELGYSTQLAGSGWNPWPDLDESVPLADFGAKRVKEALLVVPLRFDGEPPEIEALTAGLLSCLDIDYPDGSIGRPRPWEPFAGGVGLEFEHERTLNGHDYHYVLRVARGLDSAHLVAGWARADGELERVRAALDRIRLAPASGAAPRLDSARRKALGNALNDTALALLRTDRAAAEAWFRRAYAAKGDPVILDNLVQTQEALGLFEEARALLEGELGKFPLTFDLRLRHAHVLVECGRVEEGTQVVLELIERGFEDEEDFRGWIELLTEGEHHAQALRATEAWLARRESRDIRRLQADLCSLEGDPARAAALLEPLVARHPDDADLLGDLGTYLVDLGRHAEAAAIAERLLERDPDEPEALLLLGWSQMGRELYREAKTTLERAARASPDDQRVLDSLRAASAALGQGTNSDVKTPIEPVAVPPEIARELAELDLRPRIREGDASAFELNMTGYRFVRGEPLRRTETCRARILTADGAAGLSSLAFPFEPLAERVYVNRIEVLDEEGRVVERGSIADAYVLDLSEDEVASHRSMLHQPVPGLRPGRTLVWEVTFEDRAPAEEFGFERHLFAAAVPTAAQVVFVSGDVASVRTRVTQGNGVKAVAGEGMSGWVAEPVLALSEPLSVWPERRCPMVWLCGDDMTWEQVSAEYLERIQDRLEVDPSIAALAEELAGGAADERAKIAALAGYVQREIAYQGIEFGVRAQRPNAPVETLRLRYGDCKDQALLLHQLLGAAGIESRLALVSTTWSIHPELPALEQFDHMVVLVPGLGPGRLLDVTDKHLDLVRFPADGLWESHALVLDREHPRLLAPTPRPPEGYRATSRRVVTPDGADWSVEETLTLHGYYAAWARRYLGGLAAAERISQLQHLLAERGAARLADFRLEGHDDPAQPAVLVQRYRVANAISSDGARRSAALPALWERYFLDQPFSPERRSPFEWSFPVHFESDVTVRLPTPPSEEALGALREELQSEFCAWTLAPVTTGGAGELTLHFEFDGKPGSYGAERYPRFHEDWGAALRAWEQPLGWNAK